MARTDSKTSPEKVEASMILRVACGMRTLTEPWFPMNAELGGTFATVLAETALREMSVPTREMIEAGVTAATNAGSREVHPLILRAVWQAMLDAALDPGQNVVQGASGPDVEGGGYEATDGRARAALEALREPTEAMIAAGKLVRQDQHSYQSFHDQAVEVWQAMIDAALAEAEKLP